MKNNMQTLKGFRDFLPVEKRRRQYAIKTIQAVFERYGFDPIETPVLEYASLLQGKYGKEADKLMYIFEDRGKRNVGLRYDQTVPTARFLTNYAKSLPKYFRRYQMQDVFRAENTQKGRYRQFLQCDCDIFAADTYLADAEILAVFYAAYKALGFTNFKILINDRTILFQALDNYATEQVSILSIIQSIDKLEKIGKDRVLDELIRKGLSQDAATNALEDVIESNINERLQKTIQIAQDLGVPEKSLVFQPTLARGLDYYTGIIFEGCVPNYGGGSVGGGGRYNKLIANLAGLDIPAVGFAIGFDRTLEAMQDLKLMPEFNAGSQVLVTIFDEEGISAAAQTTRTLRENDISVELYPTSEDKLGKQLKYADSKNIPFVIIVGPDEAKTNKLTLKNMKTGKEDKLDLNQIITELKNS